MIGLKKIYMRRERFDNCTADCKETVKEIQAQGASKKKKGFIPLEEPLVYKHNRGELHITKMR